MNVNAWPIIADLLAREKRNQSWLAKQLKVTPAAITQIKQGLYRLSAEQFKIICKATHASKIEKDALYSSVFNARYRVAAEVKLK